MLDLVAFLIGIGYGYFNPGKEDKKGMLKKGAFYGLIVGAVFAVLSIFVSGSLISAPFTGIQAFIGVIIIVAIFVLGVWIGDWIEEKRK